VGANFACAGQRIALGQGVLQRLQAEGHRDPAPPHRRHLHARGDEDFDPAWVPFDFEAAVHELTDGDHAGFRALLWARASSQADQVAKDWAAWKP